MDQALTLLVKVLGQLVDSTLRFCALNNDTLINSKIHFENHLIYLLGAEFENIEFDRIFSMDDCTIFIISTRADICLLW